MRFFSQLFKKLFKNNIKLIPYSFYNGFFVDSFKLVDLELFQPTENNLETGLVTLYYGISMRLGQKKNMFTENGFNEDKS